MEERRQGLAGFVTGKLAVALATVAAVGVAALAIGWSDPTAPGADHITIVHNGTVSEAYGSALVLTEDPAPSSWLLVAPILAAAGGGVVVGAAMTGGAGMTGGRRRAVAALVVAAPVGALAAVVIPSPRPASNVGLAVALLVIQAAAGAAAVSPRRLASRVTPANL